MLFRQLFDYETWTYTYLLADEASREAVLIDPVITQIERDMQLLKELGLALKYSIETHVHADHITGAGQLRERTGCKTGVAAVSGVDCADLPLHDGDKLAFGRYEIEVIATPGHTSGCLSFYTPGMVFTGDALLIRGCGRTDFQQGNAAQLYESITQRLFTLSEATSVYPGHDYNGRMVSSIGEEMRFNPRLSLGREGFIEFMQSLKLPNPKKIMEAVPSNQACGKAS